MSDRFSSNPGNGGNNDDLYRWNGDQRQLPGNNHGQNQSGDLYMNDGSRQNFQNGDQDQHDAFQGDRMPGRPRPSDYPQHFTTREVTADGTTIINNIYAKNVYFNQSSIEGADFRRDRRVDFRDNDPSLARLRDNQGSTSYYEGDNSGYNVSPYNGSFRMPVNRGPNRQEMEFQACSDAYQQQRDCDQAIRIQMYNENCRHASGRERERYQPYYGGNNGGYGNYSNRGYDDGYDSRNGGPCFGNNRAGISIRIPIGNNGSFRIGF